MALSLAFAVDFPRIVELCKGVFHRDPTGDSPSDSRRYWAF
jgi:hypothetical protein